MKILLISNDLMPFGRLPTSGGGLRAWQIYQGLKAHGFEVIASMPAFTYLAEKCRDEIPPEQREYLWHFGTQQAIFDRVKPDAVIFTSNWDHYALPLRLSVPLIVDLHGPRYLETKMWNRTVSTERKVQILSAADCLLAAGKRQQLYFSGWLVQGGRVPESEQTIRYIPVSLDPALPEHLHVPQGDEALYPRFVSGGGWFPWQNQANAIFSIASAVREKNRGSIDIYGGPHERFGNSPEEDKVHAVYAKVCELAKGTPRIRVNGYVGREELIEIYRRASVAVELMQYNLERELAFTTRTVEYLWCGLPVIYNHYAELSEHIAEYDAGWTVDPEDTGSLNRVLAEIFSDPEPVMRKSGNAARLVRERFTWEKTILPLVEFLRAPVRAPAVDSFAGTIYARPTFMSARGETKELMLSAEGIRAVETRCIIPAENTAGVEVPIGLAGAGARQEIKRLIVSVRAPSGKVLARKAFLPGEIHEEGALPVHFSLLRQPRGGAEVVVRLEAEFGPHRAGSAVRVFELQSARYPIIAWNGDTPEAAAPAHLAVSFVPGEASAWYNAKVTARRAAMMLRDGDYRRLTNALRRRVPSVLYRARKLLSLSPR
jgi:glycosyltransferase involved in cell wall biosynthesis